MELRSTRRTARSLVLARLLTKCGDYAWDLAFPLALLVAYPGTLFPMALYYLLTRLAVVLFMPAIGARLDRTNRLLAIRCGISLQVGGICLSGSLLGGPLAGAVPARAIQPLVDLGGVAAAVGAAMMTVAIRADWLPVIFSGDMLAKVNQRFSQVDLVAEIVAPVFAGFVVGAGAAAGHPFSGFQLVAIFNLLSFALEYLYLSRAYSQDERLRKRTASIHGPRPFHPLTAARLFFSQPSLGVMLAYSSLFFTVLTPHGALLTSFLKAEWKVAEGPLGAFRTVGAVVGLAATVIFQRLARWLGLAKATTVAIWIQALFLVVACLGLSRGPSGFVPFVIALLISRIGVYGFMLGEVQIFQQTVDESVRGQVGGFASAVNNSLGLAVYLLAMVAPRPDQFPLVAWASAVSVSLGALSTLIWYTRRR
jgi:iron-regulated transporter 1